LFDAVGKAVKLVSLVCVACGLGLIVVGGGALVDASVESYSGAKVRKGGKDEGV
jgi:hypothetical protein